jgi:hypothetical protein
MCCGCFSVEWGDQSFTFVVCHSKLASITVIITFCNIQNFEWYLQLTLLGRGIMSICIQLPTWWRSLLPPSLGQSKRSGLFGSHDMDYNEDRSSKLLQSVCNCITVYSLSCLRRLESSSFHLYSVNRDS